MPKDFVQAIFSIDPSLRYVGIVDRNGNLVQGGMRPGVNSLNPQEKEIVMYNQTSVAQGMAETWSEYFGRHRFTIMEYEKLTVARFPFGEDILLITAELEMSLDVARKILDTLKSAM